MKWNSPNTIQRRLWFNFGIIALVNLIFGGLILFLAFWKGWLVAIGMGLPLIVVLNIGWIVFLSHSIEKPIYLLEEDVAHLSTAVHPTISTSPGEVLEMEKIRQNLASMLARDEQKMSELRQFVANASHELRTPLTTIKLRVEALSDGAIHDTTVSKKFLQEIEGEVDHLSKMVGDLLDLSRIESGNMEGSFTKVDLGSIVEEIGTIFEMRAKDLGITLEYEIEQNLPPTRGVEGQIRRLVYNLVDNAIKYNRPGGRVTVQLVKEPSAECLQLTVADTGFGIPQSYLPHIFERFYRAEATRPRYANSHGSGLGLAIVKAIADSHAIKIQVESEMGRGSCFKLDFPLSEA